MSSSALPRMSLGSWAFSFGPYEQHPWSFDQVLEFIRKAGFDGVEINGFRPHPHPDDYDTDAKCTELRKRIDDMGLGISGYAPSFENVPPAGVSRDIYLTEIRKSIQFCRRCGIQTLRVDSMSPPERMDESTYNQRFDRLASAWRDAANECQEEGITLVWEFEPGFWLNKPSEVLRLWQSVNSESFKILFDTSHAYMCAVVGARQPGEKETLPGGVAEFASLLGNAIGHLHLIDSDGSLHDNETSTHNPFGQGNIDFAESLLPIRPLINQFDWWTADFCFWPTTEIDALEAPSYMRTLAQELHQ